MEPASILSFAGLMVPLYVGMLHGWLYVQRRRETVHLWFGVTAAIAAGLAVSGMSAAGGESWRAVLGWKEIQLGLVLVLLAALLRATWAFFEAGWARAEAVLWSVAALAVLGPFARSLVARESALASQGLASGAGGNAAAAPLEQAIAAGGVALLSALLVRRVARSMAEAERLTTHLHELVDERSSVLRQKELQLAHGEQLASLGALAAGVARTIHEPVRSVAQNVTQLGLIWERPEGKERVPGILADCREGVERLRVVVSEVLAIARRSDGEMEPVDLSQVVASVLPILRPVAREGVELVPELQPVPAVLGDPRLLGQVALQLLLNAVQARPSAEGGHNRIRVSTGFEAGRVRLRVEDSGPAIPPEILPRVFDPLFTPEEGQRGPELGLAVTHQIVARHRGVVQVESDDRGTRVTVELPPAESSAATEPD